MRLVVVFDLIDRKGVNGGQWVQKAFGDSPGKYSVLRCEEHNTQQVNIVIVRHNLLVVYNEQAM